MNNLLSDSWGKEDIETGNHGGTAELTDLSSLDRFLKDADVIRSDIEELERIHKRLHDSNEAARSLTAADAVQSLRAKMDADVELVLKKARVVKARLQLLEQAAETNRAKPGSGPGSSYDRTRMSVLGGLKSKLKISMDDFAELRKEIATEYRDTVARRYYTVTGEQPDEATVEALVTTGEGEQFLQKAIAEQGRGSIMNVVAEIHERYNTVTDLERSLLELQQVFMGMAVLVQTQGEQLNDIENQVDRASSFFENGRQSLQVARKLQKNTRKWKCFAIILLLIIILAIVLPMVLKH